MSLFELNLPGFSIKPKIALTADRLVAVTPLLGRLLSLFAYRRVLIVDRKSRLITLDVHTWWLIRSIKVLSFSRVEYLWYGYGELPIDFGYVASYAQQLNEINWFNVALKVHGDSRPLLLFRFLDTGGALSEALALSFRAALLLWLLRIAGNEDSQSLALAKALEQLIGVPISSPMLDEVRHAIEDAATPCPRCGRALSTGAERCIYCGAHFSHGLSGPRP
jgi:hypothetical protein